MKLEILNTSSELMNQAQTYFDDDYIKQLSEKIFFHESVIGRYKISQCIGNKFMPQELDGIPKLDNNTFWSLSHKSGMVLYAAGKQNIGIDIEIIKPRDISVLEIFSTSDYAKLGGKNWKNFYRFWTCHESMIKYQRETNYISGMYSLISAKKEVYQISGLHFDYKLIFLRGEEYFTLYCGGADEIIYSICYNG